MLKENQLQRKFYRLKPALTVMMVFFLLLELAGVLGAQTQDQLTMNDAFSNTLNAEKLNMPWEFNFFDNKVQFKFKPGSFNAETALEIIKLNEVMPEPWQLDRISPVYQIEIKNKSAYLKTSYEVKINYSENEQFKKIFYFDKNCNCWKPMITKDNTWRNFTSTNLNFDFVRLAVFAYPDVMTVGRASWYSHKNGLFTASPDFPKGSRLRVINKNNNKFVDVVVNDYGPDRKVHPDRIVDLDKVAFKKLAATAEGSIPVVVELLSLPKESSNLFGVPDSGAKTDVSIFSGSGVIYDETSGEIVWSKYATTTRPLASLTKIMAVSTFLDTKPTLTTAVAYKTQDEKYNYEWCEPWESAKLSIKEGETLTIENLIYTSLVGSANNTIESLVRISGLSRAEFIAKMNAKAKEWGASSTTFFEPTGLSPQNVSSALDYAIITKEALKHPIIKKASTISQYKFSTINTKKPHTIKNTNSLIRANKYNITGSKTGYLEEAGYCLMTKVNGNGKNLIIVTMGAADKAKSNQDTINLISYGLRK